MAEGSTSASIGRHGASRLPSVEVDSYNIELKDENGFLGDRASKGAFQAILDVWRKPLKKSGDDPFGNKSSESISKKELDRILVSDDVEAAAVLHSAVEDFAQELAGVIRRFLKLKAWSNTEHIIVGGGFRQSRLGELAIARTNIILKANGTKTDISPIRFHPDEAGLIGGVHLAPPWILEARDAILAIDIGGSNIRCGVVERVLNMLRDLIAKAEAEGLKLAPFVGVACPGIINDDGTIEKGAQNLPGNWESSRFKLPEAIAESIPEIDGHDTVVSMHNDAVVQGLSEVPFMKDFRHWGILTIGTGLGNARLPADSRRHHQPNDHACGIGVTANRIGGA